MGYICPLMKVFAFDSSVNRYVIVGHFCILSLFVANAKTTGVEFRNLYLLFVSVDCTAIYDEILTIET